MYKIIRYYHNTPRVHRTIKTGLTLHEAQTHCRDPETSSRTATSAAAAKVTRRMGPWFDGYAKT